MKRHAVRFTVCATVFLFAGPTFAGELYYYENGRRVELSPAEPLQGQPLAAAQRSQSGGRLAR